MGLSRSRRNAEFLLAHLKSLSGRLAMRLTGNRPPTSELLALAVSHANCRPASKHDDCWVSLDQGFIVPVDDVRDLLPPLQAGNGDDGPQARPDLIYVTAIPRKGLVFRFIEVKYRRHLRAARTPEVLQKIHEQTESLHRRWHDWYSHAEVCSLVQSGSTCKACPGVALLRGQGTPASLAGTTAQGAGIRDRPHDRKGRRLRNSDPAGREPRLGVLSGVRRARTPGDLAGRMEHADISVRPRPPARLGLPSRNGHGATGAFRHKAGREAHRSDRTSMNGSKAARLFHTGLKT